MRTSRLLATVPAIVAVALLVGCVAASPITLPAPTSSPSSTPIVAPDPAAIVIAGDGLSVVSSTGEVLESTRYSEGSQALIDMVTPVLGVGRSTPSPVDSECVPAYSSTSWGDSPANSTLRSFEVRTVETPLIPGISAWVLAQAATVNGIAVRSSTGFSVGDPIAPVVAALDSDQLAGFSPSATEGGGRGYVFDTAGSVAINGVNTLYGGGVLEVDDRVASIGSPRTVWRLGC